MSITNVKSNRVLYTVFNSLIVTINKNQVKSKEKQQNVSELIVYYGLFFRLKVRINKFSDLRKLTIFMRCCIIPLKKLTKRFLHQELSTPRNTEQQEKSVRLL